MTRILITCRQMQNVIEQFESELSSNGISFDLYPIPEQQPTEDELVAALGEYDGMIAGDDPITDRVLAAAGRLKVISKWGVGVDGIDLGAAKRRGILVTNTPAVFGDDVADVAAGYLVMLARQLHRIDASVRSGGWWKHEGLRLAGKTLGVVGFGAIGQAVAKRGVGFDMHVVVHDIHPDARARAVEFGFGALDLDELLRRSMFVILCSPLTPSTHHMINRRTLGLMSQGSFIVNVARGPLIDEDALAEGLASGQIAAAALDVFEDEPLAPASRLRAFDQCVFGSHNGSNTREGVLRASALAVENVIRGLRGT